MVTRFLVKRRAKILLAGLFFVGCVAGNLYAWTCGVDTVRDAEGNLYSTVQIGRQCWLRENIRQGQMLPDMEAWPADNQVIEQWCYNNDVRFCREEGGLYTWQEAMGYEEKEKAQGVCPDGWHIPTDKEFYQMEAFLDPSVRNPTSSYASGNSHGRDIGKKLKMSGPARFSAVLTGMRNHEGHLIRRGTVTYFWTSTQKTGGKVAVHYLVKGLDGVKWTKVNPSNGLSVRCLKDP